jgi:hypothetical protein
MEHTSEGMADKTPVFGMHEGGIFRPLRPEEVAAVTYRLELRPEYEEDPTVPAIIQCLEDEVDGFWVEAAFPGRPDLVHAGTFLIELQGDRLDLVVVDDFEPEPVPPNRLGGAVKGVFQALIKQHRRDLDLLRCKVAYLHEIGLEPAALAEALVEAISPERIEVEPVTDAGGKEAK